MIRQGVVACLLYEFWRIAYDCHVPMSVLVDWNHNVVVSKQVELRGPALDTVIVDASALRLQLLIEE